MLLPATGTILVGPCPQCKKMVAIFSGQALPLDTEIMKNGSNKEKEEHLLSVLNAFIEDQIGEMIHKPLETEEASDENLDAPTPEKASYPKADWASVNTSDNRDKLISKQELADFREKELPLIDDPNYFRAIFG
jgi:hypothetical protein